MPDALSVKPTPRPSRLKLWLVIATCAAPVIASYYAYYFVRPAARSNYGALVEPQRPMPPLRLATLDGKPVDAASLRGRWLMLMVAGGDCAGKCVDRLYHLRQVLRVWLIPDTAPLSTTLIREYDGTAMLRADPAELASWLPPAAGESPDEHIYMVDPLGNLMMQFPANADPTRTKRDLAKLLRASRIG